MRLLLEFAVDGSYSCRDSAKNETTAAAVARAHSVRIALNGQ